MTERYDLTTTTDPAEAALEERLRRFGFDWRTRQSGLVRELAAPAPFQATASLDALDRAPRAIGAARARRRGGWASAVAMVGAGALTAATVVTAVSVLGDGGGRWPWQVGTREATGANLVPVAVPWDASTLTDPATTGLCTEDQVYLERVELTAPTLDADAPSAPQAALIVSGPQRPCVLPDLLILQHLGAQPGPGPSAGPTLVGVPTMSTTGSLVTVDRTHRARIVVTSGWWWCDPSAERASIGLLGRPTGTGSRPSPSAVESAVEFRLPHPQSTAAECTALAGHGMTNSLHLDIQPEPPVDPAPATLTGARLRASQVVLGRDLTLRSTVTVSVTAGAQDVVFVPCPQVLARLESIDGSSRTVRFQFNCPGAHLPIIDGRPTLQAGSTVVFGIELGDAAGVRRGTIWLDGVPESAQDFAVIDAR